MNHVVWHFFCEPQLFEKAVKNDSWREAMDEVATIQENRTLDLMDLLKGNDVIRRNGSGRTNIKMAGPEST